MPYTGDSLTNAASAAKGFSDSFLDSFQVGTQKELARARMEFMRAEMADMQQYRGMQQQDRDREQQAFEGQQQAQGDMLGMLQERVEAPAQSQVTGSLAQIGPAATFLGMPSLSVEMAQKAGVVNAKMQERIQRVRDFGARLSPKAAELFVQEQMQTIAADAAELRSQALAEEIRTFQTIGLSPGILQIENPRANEFSQRATEIGQRYASGELTGAEAAAELGDLKIEAAKEEDRLADRFLEAQSLSSEAAPLLAPTQPGMPQAISLEAQKEIERALSNHRRGHLTFTQAQDAIDRAKRGNGQPKQPAPHELYAGAVKAAEAEVGAMGGMLPEGQTFDSLIQKHMRRASGEPEPQAQQFGPEQIQQTAQLFASGQVSREQAEQLNSLPGPIKQAIAQAVQALRQPKAKPKLQGPVVEGAKAAAREVKAQGQRVKGAKRAMAVQGAAASGEALIEQLRAKIRELGGGE